MPCRSLPHRVEQEKERWADYFAREFQLSLDGKRLILVTGHRRENFGAGFENICWALRDVVEAFPDVLVVYPVHLNPNVQRPVKEILGPVSDDGRGQARVAACPCYRPWIMPPSSIC